MIKHFQNAEVSYLHWVQNNQDGYVVNVDVARSFPQYPMVHRATHKALSSPAWTNYTTGKFIKVCSLDLGALEKWARDEYHRPLTRCAVCM
jgi:hypothetical protein